jgi:cysteamine dioxygenase
MLATAAVEPRRLSHHGSSGQLNWDMFVNKLEAMAQRQYSVDWDRPGYVRSVARVLQQLNLQDPVLLRARNGYQDLHPHSPEFLDLLLSRDIQVSLISFEKGDFIPLHNHPSMTGVLTCATGNLSVISYDRVESAVFAPSAGVLLKEAERAVITPGTISTLTNVSKNIHFVKALSFTQVIDIFTPPYNAERTHKTTWFTLDERPLDNASGLILAHPY